MIRNYHDRQCSKCGRWIDYGKPCPFCARAEPKPKCYTLSPKLRLMIGIVIFVLGFITGLILIK